MDNCICFTTVRFLALEVAVQDLCPHRTKSALVSISPSISLHTRHLFHHIPDHRMQTFEQVPWTSGNLSHWVFSTLRDVPTVQFCKGNKLHLICESLLLQIRAGSSTTIFSRHSGFLTRSSLHLIFHMVTAMLTFLRGIAVWKNGDLCWRNTGLSYGPGCSSPCMSLCTTLCPTWCSEISWAEWLKWLIDANIIANIIANRC